MLFNKHATVTGTNKRRMSIAEAALEVDLVAYPKLTDMLVETRLLLMRLSPLPGPNQAQSRASSSKLGQSSVRASTCMVLRFSLCQGCWKQRKKASKKLLGFLLGPSELRDLCPTLPVYPPPPKSPVFGEAEHFGVRIQSKPSAWPPAMRIRRWKQGKSRSLVKETKTPKLGP